MSDDSTSKAPAQDITSTDTDTDPGQAGMENANARVFDITPDLNISPAKDEVANTPPIVVPDNIIPGPPQQNVDQVPKPETELKATVEPQTQFGPANPPAKTIGMNRASINDKNKLVTGNLSESSSLQEAVSNIKTTTVAPKVPSKPWEVKSGPGIKPLRTYETDFIEAMAKKRISTTSSVIAEDKRKQEQKKAEMVVTNQPIEITRTMGAEATKKTDIFKGVKLAEEKPKVIESHATRNWILGLISLILICGGLFAAYYLYLKSPIAPIKTTNTTASSQITFSEPIVDADFRSIISIDDKDRSKIISSIKTESEKSQTEKTIKEIILSTRKGEMVIKVPSDEMLGYVNIPAPDLLRRSISPDWMLGVYAGSNGQNQTFVITTNNFFQNTFAGLIQWEKTMAVDLKDFFRFGSIQPDSGQPSTSQEFTTRGQFKDRIIKNRDVREYVAEDGRIIFLYSFVSNDKLVIADNEEVLEEIISRLEKKAFVR